jgi:PAS domain S-box-containing protein
MTDVSPSKINLRLLHKGLLFAFVILACELAFIFLLAVRLNEANKELELQLKSKQVVVLANKVDLDFTEASIAVGVYTYTKWRPYRARYDYWTPKLQEDLAELKRLLKDDAAIQPILEEADSRIVRGTMLLEDSISALERPGLDLGVSRAPFRLDMLTKRREAIRVILTELTAESRRIESTSKETREASRRNLIMLLVCGVAFNIALALAFVFLFFFEITKRIGLISNNAMRLAADQPLNQVLGGSDEIAELDLVFHNMAAALKEAARKERAVIEYAADVICSIDRKLAFTAVSPASDKAWGYESEELLGRKLFDFVLPSSVESAQTALAEAKAESKTVVFETEFKRKDGREVSVLWSTFFSDKEQSYFCVAHDITERRLAEEAVKESERRIRSMIENMIVGLIVVSRQRKILVANRSATEMFDYRWEELEGRDVVSLFAESASLASEAEREEFFSQLTEKARHHVLGQEALKQSGEDFPVQMSMGDFTLGQEDCYLLNILDVSELREIERKRREFVATVTHELRTPLTSICASMALLSTNQSIDERSREMLQITDRSTQRLIKLINDLLDVDKLETGQLFMEMDLVIMSQAVKRSLEAVSAFAAKQNVTIETNVDLIHVIADEDRIVQVLVNLLSNAIKFSPQGQSVQIKSSVKDGFARMEVVDKGRGIPEKYKNALFQRFQQVEYADAKQKGGSGLGLAICRAIINQHGGAIGFESEEGKGSTFWFTIPLADDEDD